MIINLRKNGSGLFDLVDSINDSINKLSFVAEFFTCGIPGFNFEISGKGANGVHCILREIEEELYLVVDELNLKIKKNSGAAKKRAAAELKDLSKE